MEENKYFGIVSILLIIGGAIVLSIDKFVNKDITSIGWISIIAIIFGLLISIFGLLNYFLVKKKFIDKDSQT